MEYSVPQKLATMSTNPEPISGPCNLVKRLRCGRPPHANRGEYLFSIDPHRDILRYRSLLAFYLAYLLACYLAFYQLYLLAFYLRPIRFIFWQTFWYSIWHSLWYIFWNYFCHFSLANLLAFFLTYLLMFSGILFGMLYVLTFPSGILAGISSNVLWNILFDIFSGNCLFSFWHIFWLSFLHSSGISSDIFWGSL